MKRILIFSLLCGSYPAAAATPLWLRRVTAAAVCAVSGADLLTTAVGTSRGGIETNGLLAHGGRPKWGLMIGVNAGACGAALLGMRSGSWVVVAGEAAFLGPKAAAVGHNLGELGR
jgi:hypothetical protein